MMSVPLIVAVVVALWVLTAIVDYCLVRLDTIRVLGKYEVLTGTPTWNRRDAAQWGLSCLLTGPVGFVATFVCIPFVWPFLTPGNIRRLDGMLEKHRQSAEDK